MKHDWKRDFKGERIGRVEKFLHKWRGGVLRKETGIEKIVRSALADDFPVTDRQAEFVDTNFYYRVGGVDPVKAKAHNDCLFIQWGIGSRKADTFDDQVKVANDTELPYVSWIIFDPDSSMSISDQALQYSNDPDVKSNPMCVDLEKPRSTTRMINYSELRGIVTILQAASVFQVGCYSRVNIFEAIFPNGFPDWMEDVWQWIAQYLLFYDGEDWVQTRNYETFLNKWAWSLPPSVVRSKLYSDQKWRDLVWAWQLSDYGKAPYYIAVVTLPSGGSGMKSCDLNVSMKKVALFIADLFAGQVPVPPPSGDCPKDCQEQIEILSEQLAIAQSVFRTSLHETNVVVSELAGTVIVLANNLDQLQIEFNLHEHNGNTEPQPPSDKTEFLTVRVENDDLSKCSVFTAAGHDKACENTKPTDEQISRVPLVYEWPPGKPLPEEKVHVFPYDAAFQIYRYAVYSCKDNPNDPIIKTGYGEYYLVYGGLFDRCLVPAKRLEIL